MNKTELVNKLASYTGLTKAKAMDCVNALFEEGGIIARSLQIGDDVAISGFGTFTVRSRAARMGRNPSTGEPMQIAAKRIPGFHAGKNLRDRVGGR